MVFPGSYRSPKLTDLHQQTLTKDIDPILKHEVDFIYFVLICIPSSEYKFCRRVR